MDHLPGTPHVTFPQDAHYQNWQSWRSSHWSLTFDVPERFAILEIDEDKLFQQGGAQPDYGNMRMQGLACMRIDTPWATD